MACFGRCMGISTGDTSAAPGDAWENYQDTSRFAFTVHHGSVLEQAWYSEAHTQYLDQFYQENAPMDLVFISVPNWTTATNIPSRWVRLQRSVHGGRIMYQNDLVVGTWEPGNRGWIKLIYTATGRTRWYENAPGSQMWIRRAENMEAEGNWATYLAPLVLQFPGDVRPLEPPENQDGEA